MHIPVLLKEVINGLKIKEGEIFLDGTINGGGHSKAVCESLGGKITLIGIDLDSEAIEKSRKNIGGVCGKKVFLKSSSFRNLDEVLRDIGISRVDKILFDLGFSSDQIENSGRGFSFEKDENLLMTFKNNPDKFDLTASDIVNLWDEENLVEIIRAYGEEPNTERIAHAIVIERKKSLIKTSRQLAEIISEIIGKRGRYQKRHPATKTFQAIRIAVNDEITALKTGLEKGFEALSKNGRMAIISFHSLEDRIVKRFFKEKASRREANIITKKPIAATEKEKAQNPKSRSAKLRIIEKV